MEPKENFNLAKLRDSNQTEDEVAGFLKSSVKPKTNTWWTRAEYQKFHDNIEDYRRKKHLEKQKEITEKEKSFRHVGVAFAVRNDPFYHPNSNVHKGTKEVDTSDLRRPIWQERLMTTGNRSIKTGPGSLFVKSSVFQQLYDGRSSRQSQVSADSLHFSYDLIKKPAATETFIKKLQTGMVEVAFI